MKDIMIRLTGRHLGADASGEDQIEFVTTGKAYQKGDATYVTYMEGEMSGLEKVRTMLRIGRDGEILMKRFGRERLMMDTVMEFQKGKRFSSLYPTPYGPLKMEILTNKIVNTIQPEDCTGSLYIDYDIALKGIAETRNMLSIELYDPPGSQAEQPPARLS